MKNFGKYLSAQFKRAVRHCPVSAAVALVLAALLIFICAFTLNSQSKDEDVQRVKIGIVGDPSDSYLEMGITALQNLDSSRFAVEFISLEENSATDKLRSGELMGYLSIPDGFVNAALKGEYVPVTYVTAGENRGFASSVMYEVATAAETLMFESQNGVFGLESFVKEEIGKSEYYGTVNGLALRYVALILSRAEYFETVDIEDTDALTYVEYYAAALTVFFILLWGTLCASYGGRKNLSLCRLLSARGASPVCQIVCEWLPFFLFLWLSTAVLSFFALALSTFEIIPVDLGFTETAGFIISAVPVCTAITAMQFFVYEASKNLAAGVLLQLFSAVALGYVSGCFYPDYFFPDAVRGAVAFTPSGAGMNILKASLSPSEGSPLIPLLILFAYTLMFLSFTILARHRNIGGDAQ